MNKKKKDLDEICYWIVYLGGSIFTTITFLMKLDMVVATETTVFGFILNLANSFKEHNFIYFFLIPALYYFYKYVSKKREPIYKKEKIYALIPAVFFSFFMVMGYSYDTTDSWELVVNFQNFQWIKALICFAGYTIFFYYLISWLFYKIDIGNIYSNDEKLCKGVMLLKKKPFLTSFIVLCIFYIPLIIISYPAVFCWDAANQILQAYPVLETYAPPYTEVLATVEGVYLNNHHPVAHTILLHLCLEIGVKIFSSYNVGLFIAVCIQCVMMFLAIAAMMKLLVELKISLKWVVLILFYYIISPRLQSYLLLVTKDVIFSAFFLLFTVYLFRIMHWEKKKDWIVFAISVLGMILMRNDGKYLIILSIVGIAVVCKKNRRKMIWSLVSVILFSTFYFDVMLPSFNVIPGSKREVFSIPFQQTARYLRESETSVTTDEKEAISAVLDYDAIKEKYNPNLSDSVKNTFNDSATTEEVVQYFKVWIQMFFKHPSHYIQATMNNYYYYFYPGSRMATNFSYRGSENVMEWINGKGEKIELELAHPEILRDYRENYEQLREAIGKMPIILLLSTPATYSWGVILLVVLCIRKKNRTALSMTFPLCIQMLICLAGPSNGWYFRYTYPVAVCLPAIIFMCLHIMKTVIEVENDKEI